MKPPRLSICIATLNRGPFLRATLDCILGQLDDSVEVVVVDGASADDTPEVLRACAERDPRLRYERLPVKGGVDKDFCRAVELARGDYCWLFSDDDLLRPGAIAAVLRALEQNVSLVIVNAQVRDQIVGAVIEERRLAITADQRFESNQLDRLFEAIIGYISFIGCVVIDRKLWGVRSREPYLGSEFIHVGMIFQAPLPHAALVLAEPWILIRYANSQWTSRSFDIWMFKWPRLISSLESIPSELRERAGAREPWRELSRLVGARANGAYSMDTYRRLLAPQPARPWWRLAAQMVARVPTPVAAHAAYWYLKLRGADGVRLFNAKARLRRRDP